MAETPKSLDEHRGDYKDKAWEAYTFDELGHWIHLLTKRAEHRARTDKKEKDLTDAQNYLDIMQAKLNELKS